MFTAAKTETVTWYRKQNEGMSLREAYNEVNYALRTDQPTTLRHTAIHNHYSKQRHKNLNAATEEVFQASDLKWQACEAIVNKLADRGIINI